MKYNQNDRIRILGKINAALAIANCKTSTDGERQAGLEMAQKLAGKYGFKVQRGAVLNDKPNLDIFARNWKARVAHYCEFTPKYAYTKILSSMFHIMSKAGFCCYMIKNGKKVIGICYEAKMHDANKELEKLYKELCKNCDMFKKQYKLLYPYVCKTGNELTDSWCSVMEDAVYGFDYSQCSKFEQDTMKFGVEMINKFAKIKEGF